MWTIQESAAKQGVLFASHNMKQVREITFSTLEGRCWYVEMLIDSFTKIPLFLMI